MTELGKNIPQLPPSERLTELAQSMQASWAFSDLLLSRLLDAPSYSDERSIGGVPVSEDYEMYVFDSPKLTTQDRFTGESMRSTNIYFWLREGHPMEDVVPESKQFALNVCPTGVYSTLDERWLDTSEVEGWHSLVRGALDARTSPRSE